MSTTWFSRASKLHAFWLKMSGFGLNPSGAYHMLFVKRILVGSLPDRVLEFLAMVNAPYAICKTHAFSVDPPPSCVFEVLSMIDAPYTPCETDF